MSVVMELQGETCEEHEDDVLDKDKRYSNVQIIIEIM